MTNHRVWFWPAVAVLAAIGACGGTTPVGRWDKSTKKDCGGAKDEMEIDEDLEGEATILDCQDGIVGDKRVFDIEVIDQGNDHWELEVEGSNTSFDCDCDLSEDGFELDCEDCSDSGWDEFEGDWKRDD